MIIFVCGDEGINMKMKLLFPESEINSWANKYIIDLSEEERIQEEEIIDLKNEILRRGYLSKEELYKVSAWKLQAFSRFKKAELVLENSERDVREITKKVFAETDASLKLKHCVELRGVGEATASAILHLFDNNPYPLLDKHALWTVGLPWEDRTTYPFWLDYVKFCRKKATQNKVCMRTLDRALWKYSKSIPSRDK